MAPGWGCFLGTFVGGKGKMSPFLVLSHSRLLIFLYSDGQIGRLADQQNVRSVDCT